MHSPMTSPISSIHAANLCLSLVFYLQLCSKSIKLLEILFCTPWCFIFNEVSLSTFVYPMRSYSSFKVLTNYVLLCECFSLATFSLTLWDPLFGTTNVYFCMSFPAFTTGIKLLLCICLCHWRVNVWGWRVIILSIDWDMTNTQKSNCLTTELNMSKWEYDKKTMNPWVIFQFSNNFKVCELSYHFF